MELAGDPMNNPEFVEKVKKLHARFEPTLSQGDIIKYLASNSSHMGMAVCKIIKDYPDLKNAGKAPARVVETATNDDEVSTVEAILDGKKEKRKKLYLVKWEGCPDSDNSWELEEDFPYYNNGPRLLMAYKEGKAKEMLDEMTNPEFIAAAAAKKKAAAGLAPSEGAPAPAAKEEAKPEVKEPVEEVAEKVTAVTLDAVEDPGGEKPEDPQADLFKGAQMGVLMKVRQSVELWNADVTEPNERGATALHFAAAKGHEEVCQYLIGAKANFNAKMTNKRSVLMQAAMGNHLGVVKMLHAQKVDLRSQDNVGKTALDWAKIEEAPEVVKFLTSMGAPVGK